MTDFTKPEDRAATPYHGSVDWAGRHKPLVKKGLRWLERLSLAVEEPVNRLVKRQAFNPLYHTGTITVFLLVIVLVTGIYLTMFYQFGFDASYEAVSRIESNLVGRIMRATHRYASGAVVITALLHGWRMLFEDRFRGARWLAWVSGVVMAAFIWIIGITGYWLIWDERAQVITQTFVNLLDDLSVGTRLLFNYLLTDAAGTGWIFVVGVITVHLGLSAVLGLFFWLHVKRLRRPKLFPPHYWMLGLTLVLVLGAIIVPVGMLPQGALNQLPKRIPVDLFYLAYLPAGLNWSQWVLWGDAFLLTAVVSAVPWLLVRKPLPPIKVIDDRCTGCTLCAVDCPYKAIEMVPRTDGKHHKFIAVIDPSMCVSCGICIGSCPPKALTLGDQPFQPLWNQTLALASRQSDMPVHMVFTCERHAYQGGASYLKTGELTYVLPDGKVSTQPGEGARQLEIVPLTCVGMAHPDLMTQALEAGAQSVQVIGCPPEDCANREGNLWLEERLKRERLPRLRRGWENAPIDVDWVPPNEFLRALRHRAPAGEATTYKLSLPELKWGHFVPAAAIMIAVLAFQLWFSERPFVPFPAEEAQVEVLLRHQSGYPIRNVSEQFTEGVGLSDPTHLQLVVDGDVVLDEVYVPASANQPIYIFEQVDIPTGDHLLKLIVTDGNAAQQVLFEGEISLNDNEVLTLEYEDGRPAGGDPVAGRQLYNETSLGTTASCQICHSLDPDVTLVGPSFAGIASRAGSRVEGLSAEEYIYQSIVDPDAYVVEGYPSGVMVPNLEEQLTEEEIEDLVAFLMTLEE